MDINFYTFSDDERVLNKNLQFVKTIDCEFLEDNSVITPHITLDGNEFTEVTRINYAYIPRLGRFYYVRDWRLSTGNICTMELEVDVLMSFKNQILGITTLIDRQEFIYSPYIIDNELLTQVQRKLTYKKIGSLGSPSDSYFALTVTGGDNQ